jgi:hypothetical protein
MRSWVVILFVFLTLSNSSDAEERFKSSAAQERERTTTELLKQLSDSIKQLKEFHRDDKMFLDLMKQISNTCQTPEGSCPLPSDALKGTTCSCNFDKRVFGTAQ